MPELSEGENVNVLVVKMGANQKWKKNWYLWLNECRESLLIKTLKMFQINLQKDLFVKTAMPKWGQGIPHPCTK